MELIQVVQDKNQWTALVNTNEPSGSMKRLEILDWLPELASQVGLSSMEIVLWFITVCLFVNVQHLILATLWELILVNISRLSLLIGTFMMAQRYLPDVTFQAMEHH
jgi:hypothetical protein